MRWQLGLVAVAGCAFELPAGSDGGGDDGGGGLAGFTARRPITIANAQLTEALVDFPVLVTLDAASFDYAGAAVDGADLRFASDDLTLLHYEIDSFTPSATSWIWVRVPMIAPPPAPPTQIWMYYSSPGARSAASPRDVWIDHVSVHHLGTNVDASNNGHGAQQADVAKTPLDTAGVLGRAYAFDGNDDALVVDGAAAYDFTKTMTVSLWMRAPSFTVSFQCMVCKGDTAWRVHRGNGTQHADFGTTSSAPANDNLDSGSNVSGGDWHHVVTTLDGTVKKIYVDGALDGMRSYALILNTNALPVAIGENQEAGGRNWKGDLDEIRIAGAARTASWIGMEYQMVAMPAATIAIGAREAAP